MRISAFISGLMLMILLLPGLAFTADIPLRWDVVDGADGYKIHRSVDQGVTWDVVADLAVTETVLLDQPDSGLVLYRVSSYNANGETLRSWSGAWYNKDWQPPADPGNTGIR